MCGEEIAITEYFTAFFVELAQITGRDLADSQPVAHRLGPMKAL